LIQPLFLASALALVWALLAPATMTSWLTGGAVIVVVPWLALRMRLLGARSGAAIGATVSDAAAALGATVGDAAHVLKRVVAGPPPRSALVLVQTRTKTQSHRARVAAGLSRGADAYAIDADDSALLVHVLDETRATPEALHAIAARFAVGPTDRAS